MESRKDAASAGSTTSAAACTLAHVTPEKLALRPVVQIDDVGILRKGHHDIGDGGADIADHHTADDQNAHVLHPPGHRQHKGHGSHGPRKGSHQIIVAELVSIPRSRNTTMVRATASFAPLETPITNGPAMGFAKKVCSR